MKKRLLVTAALLAIATVLPSASASAHGAVMIPFEKQVVSSNSTVTWWFGNAGSGSGTIETSLLATDVNPTGSVWHVRFDSWEVKSSGTACDDFGADLAGIVNLANGRVSLNGTIAKGNCRGSHIHVLAQLDLVDFSSVGTMRITG